MAIKKGDAKYTKPFVGKTDVIVMMSVECGVSFASTCRLDYDTVHALEKMIVDSTFVEDEAGQTECDRPQMDCENCWKELHCRAKDKPQTEREGE